MMAKLKNVDVPNVTLIGALLIELGISREQTAKASPPVVVSDNQTRGISILLSRNVFLGPYDITGKTANCYRVSQPLFYDIFE